MLLYISVFNMSNTSFSNIRLIQLEDWGYICTLENKSFDKKEQRHVEYLKSCCNNGNGLIAFKDDHPAGVILVDNTTKVLTVVSLCVDPVFRKGGIGTQLLVMLVTLLEYKCDKIYLHVRQDNKIALNLYLKLGFKIVLNLPNYYKSLDEEKDISSNGYYMCKNK